MERHNILSLMTSTAAANGGQPLGRLRFEAAAGIKEYHWSKHWPRYNDLVREAGLEPNKKTKAYPVSELLGSLALIARKLGRFPISKDLRGTNSETSEKDFQNQIRLNGWHGRIRPRVLPIPHRLGRRSGALPRCADIRGTG